MEKLVDREALLTVFGQVFGDRQVSVSFGKITFSEDAGFSMRDG